MADEEDATAPDGDSAALKIHPDQPSWFTPKRLLFIFCVINLLNYLDRGAIASNGVNGVAGDPTCQESEACFSGSGIQGDFRLDNYHDGIISSAFMVGFVALSPVFAQLSKRYNPFRLIGVGLLFWTIATFSCGLSVGFWSITLSRMLVGIGEASFVSLAAPFIDDVAPPGQGTIWLSIFYMCIPVGVAAGYVYGGLVGGLLHWRAAFFIEALLMLPFAVFGFISKPLQMKVHIALEGGPEDSIVEKSKGTSMWERLCSWWLDLFVDLKVLFSSKVYATNVLGYVAFNFVLGAYSYWGPKAGQAIYNLDNADIVFGVVTILAGVFGTVFGGILFDYFGSTGTNGLKFLAVVTFVGGVGCIFAFLSKAVWSFILLLGVGEFFLFATQGPVNKISIGSVSPEMRPLAMAMSTVLIHVFGDVPSSPLVGKFQDWAQDWRFTALVLTCVYFVAAAIWSIGFVLKPPQGHELLGPSRMAQGESDGKSQEVPFLAEI